MPDRNRILKYLFAAIAAAIVLASLWVSSNLVKALSREEENKMKIWAEAMRKINASNAEEDISFPLQIINSNTNIPVVLCNQNFEVIDHRNIKLPKNENEAEKTLKKKVTTFREKHEGIVIENGNFNQYVFYDDSYTLKRLQAFPYVQIGILSVFIMVSFWALLSAKRAEQNKVWVGLSKETAHQLGTPISSLMAWIEYLRMKDVETSITQEMEKDTLRLQVITDRFSKIGAKPATQTVNMQQTLQKSISYLQNRISKQVELSWQMSEQPLSATLSEPLFDWVIENLTKNAIDAMSGRGAVKYSLTSKNKVIYLDISDTGKGIPKSKFKTVFRPGYTTKSRGWGLGLSLVKRIIEEYHNGKIFVKSSEINTGTTFRIELKAAENI